MSTIRFTPGLDGHTVQFAYNPAVVELIKTTVPGYARSWNQHRRVWTVDPTWTAILADALRVYGHTVTGLDDPPSRQQHATDPAGWARAVFTRVGPGRAPLAYRLLSKLCHPDTPTGDHQLMQELNRAYAELPAERKTA